MIKRLFILNPGNKCCNIMSVDLLRYFEKKHIAQQCIRAPISAWDRGDIKYKDGDFFFVMLPHFVNKVFPKHTYWLYFLEQNLNNVPSDRYKRPQMLELLQNSIENFDYNKQNIEIWHSNIPRIKFNHLPIPIYSEMFEDNESEKKFDILFYGVMSSRRQHILKKIMKINPTYRCCISQLLGDTFLKKALHESKIVLNIHGFDNDTKLEQVRLHEVMRYNIFIISELPGVMDHALLNQYRPCVDFIDEIDNTDDPNIDELNNTISYLLKQTESAECDYNLENRKLFAQNY